MCFFCNCNLLTFGRIAIPVKYDKKKSTVATMSTGLNFIFTLDFTLEQSF